MREILETSLLAAVAVLAAVLRLIGQRPGSGMTGRQKKMLWRVSKTQRKHGWHPP